MTREPAVTVAWCRAETIAQESNPFGNGSETLGTTSETVVDHNVSNVAAKCVFAPRIQKRRRQNRSRGWMRLRDREQLRLQSLQLDVNNLHQEIESLQIMRSLLHTRILNQRTAINGSYVQTTRQYFEMMHNGYHDMVWPRNSREPVHGREYLASIMDTVMQMGRLVGLDAFIHMWKRYTRSFDGLKFELLNTRVIPSNKEDPDYVIVVATSRFECSVGEQGIHIVFPHLTQRPGLRDRLVGRVLHGLGQYTIVFDAKTHRVVRFDMALDVVSAMLNVLGSPELVAAVLSEALMTHDGCIGDLTEFQNPTQSQEEIEKPRHHHKMED